MVIPVVRIIHGHADHPPSHPACTGHQNPSGGLGKTGFHPVRTLQPPEQLVVVCQVPLANGNRAGGDGFPENGIFHGVGCQFGQIPGGGIVAGSVQAVGIFKVGICQAKISGLVVHQFRKALHRAAAVDGKRHRRVVAGGQHQPVQQLLEGQHLSLLQIHGGALDAHRLPGNPHSVQHVALLADHQSRHDLGGAGNQPPLPGVFLKKHPSGDPIQHIGMVGGNRPRRCRQKQCGGQQRCRRPCGNSFHISHPGVVCPGKCRLFSGFSGFFVQNPVDFLQGLREHLHNPIRRGTGWHRHGHHPHIAVLND